LATNVSNMPLDPNKLQRKESGVREAALFAAEWSAIIFSGMLAVLFLSWAFALWTLPDGASAATEQARHNTAANRTVLLSVR
jgi:hypothetical protein